jgi:hypothetical protein
MRLERGIIDLAAAHAIASGLRALYRGQPLRSGH